MPRPHGLPAERAERFLIDASQFRLGDLLTEAPHPRSLTLSDVARRSAADGLAMLFDVDRDVVDTYDRWSRGDDPQRLCDLVTTSLLGGGRLFFTGCGATGRLSIQLASIWRGFWQERRVRGLAAPSPDTWEHRAFSVMAGGDYALIKSVEGFEDFAPFGRRQLADLGVSRGDVVFAITEGGETSFVIGTAWEGLDAGAEVVFVYNNPDEVLRAHVERSRAIIDEPRVRQVNLTTGPMAVTGSTRMQATSIQLLVMLTVLEMALRNVLQLTTPGTPVADAGDVPAAMRDGIAAVHRRLLGEDVLHALGDVVCAEERVYRAGGRVSYFADRLAIDVLTDTTERSPTFCLPSFRKWDDARAADSWAFLFTPAPTSEHAWRALLRREPQTIEWTADDLRVLLDEEAAEKQALILSEIGHRDLMRFRIGLDGLAHRPVRAGDGMTAVATIGDLEHLDAGGAIAVSLRDARDSGAGVCLVAVGSHDAIARIGGSAAAQLASVQVVPVAVPDAPFLLDPLVRVAAKMVLNALSTCVMVRMGRVLGNRMIWVVPSNLKLIDRSIRYIRDLAGVSYEDACHTLFEVIDYVEPRRSSGQAYPAPVGVATMRLRHGLDLPAAEARLYEELA